MIDRSRLQRLVGAYPGLRDAEPEIARRLATESTAFRAAHHEVLFEEADFCKAYPLIVSGSVRVTRSGFRGREIVLYHVAAGEYCLLSAVGVLAGSRHPARAIAEGRTSGVVLPPGLFRDLMRGSRGFSADVYAAVSERVDILVGLIEQISVLNIDQRLAMLLLARGTEVRATHQELADEIGCARENVSRALGRLQRKGSVVLGRARVTVLDTGSLAAIAASGGGA